MEHPDKESYRNIIPKFGWLERRREARNLPKGLSGQEPSLNQVFYKAERQRLLFNLRQLKGKTSRTSLLFAGVGGLSLLLALAKSNEIANARDEIEFRKEQLKKPVYEINGDELTNFPWNKDNLKEWLYRPIRITGRPIHGKAMLVPRIVEGYRGFDYIVPFVTKENEDGSHREGILLNKGWIPHEYQHVGSRIRIENALPQTFDCFVSLNSEIDDKASFSKAGNAASKQHNAWGHVYLPDMIKVSGLKNDGAKIALLERVEHESQLNERITKHYEMSLDGAEDYPYPKTLTGALQLRKMPWELKKEQGTYLAVGLLSSGLALALRFVA